MRPLRPALLSACLAAGAVLADGASLRIQVSATIPPRPCEYPDPCPRTADAATSTSRAAIVEGRVLYVGHRPAVTRDGDLLTVRF